MNTHSKLYHANKEDKLAKMLVALDELANIWETGHYYDEKLEVGYQNAAANLRELMKEFE